MTKITKEEIIHVAKLARLEITDEEVSKYTPQLESILEYASKISEIDTNDVAPTSHPLEMVNVLRQDEIGESLTQEQALSNAPQAESGRFKVPQILGEEGDENE